MVEVGQKSTPEEIRTEIEQWRREFKAPKGANAFFKGSNINKLADITNSATLTELEILSSSGELGDEEITEYYTLLPEFQDTIQEVDKLIDEMFTFIKPRIPKAAQQVFRNPPGREGYHTGPLTEMLNTIGELTAPFLLRHKAFFIFHNLPAT